MSVNHTLLPGPDKKTQQSIFIGEKKGGPANAARQGRSRQFLSKDSERLDILIDKKRYG